MRLRNMYILCQDNIENIHSLEALECKNCDNYVDVSGWDKVLEARKNLASVNYIKEEMEDLFYSVPEIYRYIPKFRISNGDWKRISKKKDALLERLIALDDMYKTLNLPSEKGTGIDVKLPKCTDFADFKKYIDELDFILYKCPFFKVDGEDLRFGTVDVGSMWLNFLIVGFGTDLVSRIVSNIVAFIDKCVVLKSHKINIQQQKILVETMQMEQQEKQNILNSLDKIYKAQVELVISELEVETGIKLKDGEERGVVSQSFEKANALIDKGLQIYTTIDSSEETKLLFKPLEMKYLEIEKKIELLEDNNNGEDNNSEEE